MLHNNSKFIYIVCQCFETFVMLPYKLGCDSAGETTHGTISEVKRSESADNDNETRSSTRKVYSINTAKRGGAKFSLVPKVCFRVFVSTLTRFLSYIEFALL
jgi:hypothetical protein